ncbi:hypothetical protein XAB3213_3080006 [Xanthomonas citri pv. bilvae]|nr:hypothetical protein XAB3213_3080006 [Xanthomonas citri pv. bilvae]
MTLGTCSQAIFLFLREIWLAASHWQPPSTGGGQK